MRIADRDHKRLRELIEEAVEATLYDHPDYVQAGKGWYLKRSLTKRLLGRLKSSVEGGAPGATSPR